MSFAPSLALAVVLAMTSSASCAHRPTVDAEAGARRPPETIGRTRIVMLGTGTPVADPERSGPSVAVVVDGTPYLVDAGPGVVRRAAAAARETPGLAVKNLKLVFFTHLHSDHTLGYPDLILSPAVLHRKAPLVAYGPRGLADMTAHLLAAWSKDIDIRLHGLEHGDPEAYVVVPHEIEPGIVYVDDKVTVRAFLVKHGSWDEALGYRFETPDRTIVISGDTAPSDEVVRACNGCDVLVHEVYSSRGFAKLDASDQKYHSTFHTSAPELARIATAARPRRLVLYHQLFFGVPEATLVDEVRAAYSGDVTSAHDLQIF
jgi:ribonuclease BN (tRNA processing enzyme)